MRVSFGGCFCIDLVVWNERLVVGLSRGVAKGISGEGVLLNWGVDDV